MPCVRLHAHTNTHTHSHTGTFADTNTHLALETTAVPITNTLIYSWAARSQDHQATSTPTCRDSATNWAQIYLSPRPSLERVITRLPAQHGQNIFYNIRKTTRTNACKCKHQHKSVQLRVNTSIIQINKDFFLPLFLFNLLFNAQ